MHTLLKDPGRYESNPVYGYNESAISYIWRRIEPLSQPLPKLIIASGRQETLFNLLLINLGNRCWFPYSYIPLIIDVLTLLYVPECDTPGGLYFSEFPIECIFFSCPPTKISGQKPETVYVHGIFDVGSM